MNRRRFLLTLPALAAAGAVRTSRAAPPPTPGSEAPTVTAGNTAFACDLYGQLRAAPGGLFYSPFSVSAALAMTAAGARGPTRAEMDKVLHLPADAGAGFAAVLRGLRPGPDAKYDLHIANALWGQQGLPFRPDFLAASQKDFGATLHPVDFRQTEQARQTINRWVEAQTKDRIKDLLPPGSLNALTGLVLTNAIYFKGRWVLPFHKELTKDEPFTLAGGRKAPVPLMRRGDQFRYFAGDGLQAVELPYVGNKVSMVVLLPAQADGLADLEKSLTPEKLAGWVGQLRPRRGDVLLPKFTATASFELGDVLEKLGMRLAFSPQQADFSGILTDEKLSISKVVHKAFVDVNEEGSEAAAATGVVMTLSAAPVNPPAPFTFRADHPFVYLIRDTATGGVLFLGRYAGPGA